MAFLSIARGLYTKMETSPGAAANPIGIDHTTGVIDATKVSQTKVRVRELDFTIDPQVDDENSKYLTGDFTGDESIVGKIPGSISYSMKFAPGQFEKDTTNDTSSVHKLNYRDFFKNACLNEIVITDKTVTEAEYSYPQSYLFYPSTAVASETMSQTVVDKDAKGVGIGYDLNGTMSNFTLTADGVGAPFMMKFEGAGGVNNVYEISAPEMKKLKFDGANVMETVASKYLNTIVRITDIAEKKVVEDGGGTYVPMEFCTNKLELASGNNLAEVECQASASGILYNTVTGQEPRLTLNPELKELSEFDFFKALTNERFYEIEIIVNDKAAKDNSDFVPLRVFIPRAQMLSAPVTDDNGFMRNDITFRPLGNKDKEVPMIHYTKDDGTAGGAFDFSGTILDGTENEMTYAIIISEEYLKDI